MEYLEVEDSKNFNYTIVYSMLLRKSIKIKIIGSWDLKDDFVKLVCALSTNAVYKYDKVSNMLTFTPGALLGGKFVYQCKDEIANYIVPLLVLLPFNGSQIAIKFKGITNHLHSTELIKIAHFTLLKHFEIPGCELVVRKTGFYPDGDGEVDLFCGSVGFIKNVDMTKHAELIKTRALLISSRLNSSYISEMSNVISGLLGDLNLKIYTNVHNSKDSGPSPGYQCTLFMESKEGIFYVEKDGRDRHPQEVAKEASLELLVSANRGGLFDEKLYPLLFSFLAISTTDISLVTISRITEDLSGILKLLKLFFGYEVEHVKSANNLTIKSTGCGIKNFNKNIN